MKVDIKILENGANLELPSYATPGSAGMDLRAAIAEPISLKVGDRTLVPCGISIATPPEYNAEIRPRSGLALKHGITVLNTPGTIDSDYRGEVKVLLINFGTEDFTIEPGMRVAQLVFQKVGRVEWNLVENLDSTNRADGGYGSTGTK